MRVQKLPILQVVPLLGIREDKPLISKYINSLKVTFDRHFHLLYCRYPGKISIHFL